MKTRLIAALFIIISIAFYFALIIIYGINFPVQDDYNALLKFIIDFRNSNSLTEKIGLLFSQNWEHRILSTKLFALAEYWITGKLNFIVLNVAGNAGLLVILWVLYKHLNKPFTAAFVYLIPVVLLLFNFSYYETSFWAVASLGNIWVTAFGILALYFLFQETTPSLVLSIFFACFAAFSMGNGIIAFIAGFIVMALNNKLFSYKGLLFVLFFFLCVIGYFYHYTFMRHFHVAELYNIGNLKAILRFCLVFMGRCFSDKASFAIIGGTVLTFLFLLTTYKKFYRSNPALYSYLLFIFGTAAIAALGRYHSGLEQALCVRYAFFPSVFMAATYVLAVNTYTEKIKPWLLTVIICYSLGFNLEALLANLGYPIFIKQRFDRDFTAVRSGKISDFSYEWGPGEKTTPEQILKLSDSLNIFNFKFNEQKNLLEAIPYSDNVKLDYKIEQFDNANSVKSISGWCALDEERGNQISIFISITDSLNREVKFLVPQIGYSENPEKERKKSFICEFNTGDLKPGEYSLTLLATNGRYKVSARLDTKIRV